MVLSYRASIRGTSGGGRSDIFMTAATYCKTVSASPSCHAFFMSRIFLFFSSTLATSAFSALS